MYFKCISNLFHFSLSTVLVLHPYNFSPGTGLQLPAVLPSPMTGGVFYLTLHLLLSTTVLKSSLGPAGKSLYDLAPACLPCPISLSLFVSLPHQNHLQRDFPGGPVVKTLCPLQGGVGSIPGQGTKIPQSRSVVKKKKKDHLQIRVHQKSLSLSPC